MDKKGSYDFGSFSELKVKHKFVFFIIKELLFNNLLVDDCFVAT